MFFVIPGNHDIENPWARNYVGDELIKIDSITNDEFRDIYALMVIKMPYLETKLSKLSCNPFRRYMVINA